MRNRVMAAAIAAIVVPVAQAGAQTHVHRPIGPAFYTTGNRYGTQPATHIWRGSEGPFYCRRLNGARGLLDAPAGRDSERCR